MQVKDNVNEKSRNGCLIVFILIIGAVFIIPMISNILETQESMRQSNLEHELIMKGKETDSRDILLQAIEYMKNKNFEEMEELLSYSCDYFADGKKYSLEDCLNNLIDYETCKYEQRGNTSEDEVTYRIYWNGDNTENAKQIITIMLEKKVTKEEITYEITSIVLSNNTL